jgi:hypothetical protein
MSEVAMQIKLSLIIALIDLLMVLVYIALIRPKYVNAKSISDTREWLFKQMGLSDTISAKSDAS